jgi:hypothetical protein
MTRSYHVEFTSDDRRPERWVGENDDRDRDDNEAPETPPDEPRPPPVEDPPPQPEPKGPYVVRAVTFGH